MDLGSAVVMLAVAAAEQELLRKRMLFLTPTGLQTIRRIVGSTLERARRTLLRRGRRVKTPRHVRRVGIR